MDANAITLNVKSGEFSLIKYEGKSDCWRVFQKVQDNDRKEVFGAACCSRCQTTLMYKKRENTGKV